jgi:hypothetical protein
MTWLRFSPSSMIRADSDWAATGAAAKNMRPAVASKRVFEIMTFPPKRQAATLHQPYARRQLLFDERPE